MGFIHNNVKVKMFTEYIEWGNIGQMFYLTFVFVAFHVRYYCCYQRATERNCQSNTTLKADNFLFLYNKLHKKETFDVEQPGFNTWTLWNHIGDFLT